MRLQNSHTRIGTRIVQATLIASLSVGLMAGSVFAGKGGGNKPSGGSGSVTGPVMVVDTDADGVVSYGDDITFNVSASSIAYPQVGLRCYQGTTFVYDAYVGYWATYQWDRFFRLESGYWNSELAATCTARLFYNDSRGRQQVVSTLTFGVAS
jgi:hypothetical protein